MGSLFSAPKTPSLPPPPPPLDPTPNPDELEATRREEVAKAAKRKGRSSTILTPLLGSSEKSGSGLLG